MKLNFRLCLIIERVVYDECFCPTIQYGNRGATRSMIMKSVVMGEIARWNILENTKYSIHGKTLCFVFNWLQLSESLD